jgi:hypothetical protein
MGRGDQERQHSGRLIANSVASVDVESDFGPAVQLHSGYLAPKNAVPFQRQVMT